MFVCAGIRCLILLQTGSKPASVQILLMATYWMGINRTTSFLSFLLTLQDISEFLLYTLMIISSALTALRKPINIFCINLNILCASKEIYYYYADYRFLLSSCEQENKVLNPKMVFPTASNSYSTSSIREL